MKREHSIGRLPMATGAKTGLTLSLEEAHENQQKTDDWRERLVMNSEGCGTARNLSKLKPAQQFEEAVILVLSGVRGLALDVTYTAISFANSLPFPNWIRKFIDSLTTWLPFPTLPTSPPASSSGIGIVAESTSLPSAHMAPSVHPIS